MSTPSAPVYRKFITPAQMAEESRKATAEGMKQVAEALAERTRVRAAAGDDSGSDYGSDSEPPASRRGCHHRTRSRSRSRGSNGRVTVLEQRLDLMRLEIANAKVDAEEATTALKSLQDKMMYYKRIDNELALIKSAIARIMKGLDVLTISQLEQRLKLFKEEIVEHSAQCNANIMRLEHDEIKAGIVRVVEAEKRKSAKLAAEFSWVIWTKKAYNISLVSAFVALIVVLLAIWISNL